MVGVGNDILYDYFYFRNDMIYNNILKIAIYITKHHFKKLRKFLRQTRS